MRGMSQPLKTGAKFMTEYAADDPERPGIAARRWLQPLVEYCRYHTSSEEVQQNKYR